MVSGAFVGEQDMVDVEVSAATVASKVMCAHAPVSVVCGARACVIVRGGFERMSGAAEL